MFHLVTLLKILGILVVFILLLLIGAGIYQTLEEDISYRDSLYVMTSSATTIGYTKHEPSSGAGIWFLMFYSLCLVVYFLGSFFVISQFDFV